VTPPGRAAAGIGLSVAVTTTGSSFATGDSPACAAPASSNAKNVSGLVDTPAPYAGPNRIRFNGFAGPTGISGLFETTPRQGGW
jgi:hypothetical protein